MCDILHPSYSVIYREHLLHLQRAVSHHASIDKQLAKKPAQKHILSSHAQEGSGTSVSSSLFYQLCGSGQVRDRACWEEAASQQRTGIYPTLRELKPPSAGPQERAVDCILLTDVSNYGQPTWSLVLHMVGTRPGRRNVLLTVFCSLRLAGPQERAVDCILLTEVSNYDQPTWSLVLHMVVLAWPQERAVDCILLTEASNYGQPTWSLVLHMVGTRPGRRNVLLTVFCSLRLVTMTSQRGR
ncbi:hypothetical protein J6590_016000 [Homalodisca vitripennis]|nr:hypothetical protein J6590_016000 [Homalodisca vitripennis]